MVPSSKHRPMQKCTCYLSIKIHLGNLTCRIRQVLFWPGMLLQIEETVAACQGVCGTLQNKPKGIINPNGDSRSTLGECRSKSLWVQQQSLPGHDWLLLKVARNIVGRSDRQERHLIHEESDLQVRNSRWGDHGQRTSVSSIHQTHNIQPLPPKSNWQAECTVQTVEGLLVKAKDL